MLKEMEKPYAKEETEGPKREKGVSVILLSRERGENKMKIMCRTS